MITQITVSPMPEQYTEVASIRMPEEMMSDLAKLAESEKRPVAMMARILLEEALEARAKKSKKN